MPVGASRALLIAALSLFIGGCGGDDNDDKQQSIAYASTYEPLASDTVLITNARVLIGNGEEIENGSVLMQDGRVVSVGKRIRLPRGATEIDAEGGWVTPGLIDTHSHLGVYASPGVRAHSDGNEMTNPVTAEVWAEHSVWPQDPGFATALAGGVTSLQILPGSANLFGGRSVTLKNVPSRTMQGMKFPDAPYGLKMACGENPKRVYGEGKGSAPGTRMGNVAGYRKAWIAAQKYQKDWKEFAKNGGQEPQRDLQLETLAGVLNGEILVHNHCYRADEMAVMLDVAKEFGYSVTSFHHAIEAYKIADLLATSGTCASMWADWWGFKMEAFDAVRENIPMVHKAGACAIVHSDSRYGIQRLNQEAAKAMAAGHRVGLKFAPKDAIQWITRNPAKALGILDKTGTLEEGKHADVVVWSGNPFSVYSQAVKVFIDGALIYDREDPSLQPVSDFLLGNRANHGGQE
ncbi:MAG: amidohydrolase family protein [Gammaproteobacteria bacterium]|nr:amidohydrolase family protein [Gammaproteobacteria bacterium]